MRERLGKLIEEMLDKKIDLPVAVREFEQIYIEKALARCDGVVSRAAETLGVHRNTLRSKMVAPRRRKTTRRRRKR